MSYLDKTGLTHFFEKLKGVFAAKERGVEYIRGTWTAASGTWTGVTKDSELYDGKQIILYMPFAGSGNATLNLTLAGGGTTGAKNVYFEGTTRFTTHKGQNSQLPLVYHKALKLSNGTTYEGWWYLANRDTNDNRTHTLRLYNKIKAKKAIAKNTFIVGDADGYETLAVGVTFDIAYPVLFCGVALAVNGTNYADLYEQWYDLTLTSTLSSFVGVAGKMIYLVGTLSGTKFTVASPGATCEEPTSEDGKVYLLLGRCGINYSDSEKNRVNLIPEHPLYAYQNGSFRPYVPPVDAEKVNGHTINADVPSGAKFTDTTYTAATAAPGKVASASAQGTSTNYARQDHTHGIDVATGDANGQVKIAGQNASVKGLAALAYKESLAASDIPELDASKITAGTLPVSRGGTGKTTAKDAANDFMNALDTGSSTPADADYYISQYVNGGNTTKTYHRRPMSALWAYIQGKIQAWAKNLTAKGNLGWTDQTAGKIPVTNNTLAYWDGRYNASASNLTYCVKGAFGNLAVKDSLGKSDVGLSNVDNTSDTNKPVSTAQRKAIDDKVPLIISSQTTTTNHWTGEAPFASLEDGQTIRYHLVRDPTGTADLTLTLFGGTDTPAYPIYFNTFSRVTTHFAVGQIITMTFRTNVQRNATGTKYTGWFVNDYRDSDTVTRGMWDASAAKVGSGNKVFGYSLFMEKADGTFESIALSGGTGTGKTKNSAGFRPGRIWYNESSTERASGAVLPYGTYYRQLDLRYSTNCAQTLTAQKPVYLVGEIIEGLFYIHGNNFIAQDLPTSEDGLAYMYLGGAYNTYCVALMPDHPIYIYQGGRIKRWLEGIRTINGVGAGEDGNIDLEVDDITGNLISGSKVVRSVNEISPDDSGNVNVHTGWHAYLVWENANPSATFAAQTISLDLSHFDWVLIEARHFEEGNTTGYSTMLCRKGQTTSLLVISHTNNRDGLRPALVTDTGVQFSVCTYNNGTNNNYGVPLRIYAISGTEATIAELVKEYIFKNGSFASPLVNSWGTVGNVATMNVTDGVITMKSTTTSSSSSTKPAYGYATTPIDLTNYKEFRARVKVKGNKGGAVGFSAAVPTSVANDVSSCGFAAYSQPTNSTATYEGWISVDISALSGNHYLGMWATGYHVSGSTSSPVGTVLIYEAYLIPNDE